MLKQKNTTKKKQSQIGIYRITCLVTRKVYIGQTIRLNKRINEYATIKNDKQPKICRSIKKHGWKNHKFTVLETFKKWTVRVNKREIYWKKHYIKLYSWKKMLFCEIYDIGSGGPRSKEVGRKISKSKKGVPFTQEHINNLIATSSRRGKPGTFLGRHHTKKTIALLKKLNKRPPCTEEQRLEMRKNSTRNKPVCQKSLKGKIIKKFISASEAARQIGGCSTSISACAARYPKNKTAYGYKWDYI